jgi:hypothetical protein
MNARRWIALLCVLAVLILATTASPASALWVVVLVAVGVAMFPGILAGVRMAGLSCPAPQSPFIPCFGGRAPPSLR